MPTFTEAQVMALVSPVFWPFLRILAVFSSAPIFSSRSVPMRSRVALAFLVAVCAQAALPAQEVIALTDPRAFEVTMQQVVVGIAIGLAVRIVFSAVELAGEIIGLQMGLNFAGFFDPSTNAQTSTVGRFFGNTTMLLFVVMGGHLMLLQAVVSSFTTFPVGGGAMVGPPGWKGWAGWPAWSAPTTAAKGRGPRSGRTGAGSRRPPAPDRAASPRWDGTSRCGFR